MRQYKARLIDRELKEKKSSENLQKGARFAAEEWSFVRRVWCRRKRSSIGRIRLNNVYRRAEDFSACTCMTYTTLPFSFVTQERTVRWRPDETAPSESAVPLEFHLNDPLESHRKSVKFHLSRTIENPSRASSITIQYSNPKIHSYNDSQRLKQV